MGERAGTAAAEVGVHGSLFGWIYGEVEEIDCVVCWMEDMFDVLDDVYILIHICPSVANPYRIMRIVIRETRAQKAV